MSLSQYLPIMPLVLSCNLIKMSFLLKELSGIDMKLLNVLRSVLYVAVC